MGEFVKIGGSDLRCRVFRHFPQAVPHLHKIYTACVDFPLARLTTASASFRSYLINFMAHASLSSRRNQLLEWFPFYVHHFIGDARYKAMKDYHQAWFLNLLFASWVSERPGYLPDDGQLWRLANARTRQFFEKESAPVMGMFEHEGTITDGVVWIYNRVDT